jgi:hypothetical protein
MLTSIAEYCSTNLAGLTQLLYVPATWIDPNLYDRIIGEDRTWEREIGFLDELDWLRMPLLSRGRRFSESMQRSAQGQHYEPAIEGIVPNLRPEVTDQFELMENHRFLVLLTDRNRKPWLIGTKDFPLQFSAQADGAGDNGLNNYRITFSAQQPRRMYAYIPFTED